MWLSSRRRASEREDGVCFLCLPPDFSAVPHYSVHARLSLRPSQNRACAINAHGSSQCHSHAFTTSTCMLCDAISWPPVRCVWAQPVRLYIARPCVISFPPAELPAFADTTKQSDSPCPINSASLTASSSPIFSFRGSIPSTLWTTGPRFGSPVSNPAP